MVAEVAIEGLFVFAGQGEGEFAAFGFRERLELFGESRVLGDELEFRHADDAGRYGQGHGVVEEFVERGLADDAIGGEDFHGQDAHLLFDGYREGDSLKAGDHGGVDDHASFAVHHADEGGVEGHLGTVEVVAFEGGFEDVGVGVAGDADEADGFAVAHFEEAIEDAALFLDGGEVGGIGQGVDVDEVDAIGLEVFKAGFEAGHGFIGVAFLDFGDKEDLFAAGGHDFADAGFAHAIAVGLSGIDVVDAAIDGFVEGFEGLLLLFVGEETAAAADAEDRDANAGFAEEAGGEFPGFGGVAGGGDERSHGGGFEEVAAAESHPGLMLADGRPG